jgi:hypothetical protein
MTSAPALGGSPAAREQVARIESAGDKTGDGDLPGRAFHDEVLGFIGWIYFWNQ